MLLQFPALCLLFHVVRCREAQWRARFTSAQGTLGVNPLADLGMLHHSTTSRDLHIGATISSSFLQ